MLTNNILIGQSPLQLNEDMQFLQEKNITQKSNWHHFVLVFDDNNNNDRLVIIIIIILSFL